MFQRFLILLKIRLKEFYRDKASFGWNLAFPFLIIFGFYFIFNEENQTLYKVGLLHNSDKQVVQNTSLKSFEKTKYIEFIKFSSYNTAIDKLTHHGIDLLVDPSRKTYWVSKTSPKGYICERLLHASQVRESEKYTKEFIKSSEIRYVEWMFPGILGMNMMFSALFGVGYVIIRYRKNGVLRRFSVTPTRTIEFLSAQIISRIVVLLVTTAIVYVGCTFFLKFETRGSLFDLFLVFFLGGLSMISLSLLVAARSSSEEFAGGVLNLITWPMVFLSEVWFSLEGAHPFIKKFSKIFPLTHLIDGARKIMNDGARLIDIKTNIFILLGMMIIFLIIGSILFKWERN